VNYHRGSKLFKHPAKLCLFRQIVVSPSNWLDGSALSL
jgi:hypothetical protein